MKCLLKKAQLATCCLLSFLILCLLTLNSQAQSHQHYADDLRQIARETSSRIGNHQVCDDLARSVDDLRDEVQDVLEDQNIEGDELENLIWAKKNAEALAAFIRTVGKTSTVSLDISREQLAMVKQLFDFSITEIHDQKYCCKIFKIGIGKYVCLLAYKDGPKEIFNIKSKISSGGNKTVSTVEMGLEGNSYRRLWSNENNSNKSDFKVLSIQCTLRGTYSF